MVLSSAISDLGFCHFGPEGGFSELVVLESCPAFSLDFVLAGSCSLLLVVIVGVRLASFESPF